MIEVIGYIGAIAFTICGLPLAVETWKLKEKEKINVYFLFAWLVGNTCMLIYSIHLGAVPLILDYCLNSIFLAVIYYVKWKYK